MVADVTTPAADVTTPHFAWPFRLGGDRAFAVTEQDTLDEIQDCVIALFSTEIGSREELPDYGIPDPTFSTVIDYAALQQAVDDWEDRAVVDLSDTIGSPNELERYVRVIVSEA